VVATSYLLGVSTPRVDKLVDQLGIKGISFVWMDALTLKVREGGRIINVHVWSPLA
jgi:putative transposase